MAITDPVVVPTILTADAQSYRSFVESYNTFAKRVQVDIADGDFTATQTVPLNTVWWPQGWQIDIHLMVARPSTQLDTLLKLKPSLVILHAEAGEDLTPTMTSLKNAGIKVGVALLPNTYPGDVKNYLAAADHVLIFAGALGQQGGKADLLQIEKIDLIEAINLNAEIGWDGGINMDNIRTIAHAGVDILNVGSAIVNAQDRAATFKALGEEALEHGVRIA